MFFYTWSFGGNHLTKARWFESFLRAPYPDPDLENSWSCTFQHCCNYIWSWYRLDSVRITTFVGTKSVVNYRYIGSFFSTQAIQVPITGADWNHGILTFHWECPRGFPEVPGVFFCERSGVNSSTQNADEMRFVVFFWSLVYHFCIGAM
jgi:hypothetical protein